MKYIEIIFLIFLIFLFSITILIPICFSSGIGISPEKLEITAILNETYVRSFYVYNYYDKKIELDIKGVDIMEKNLSIQPNEKKNIKFKIATSSIDYNKRILITTKDDSNFKPMLSIPVNIIYVNDRLINASIYSINIRESEINSFIPIDLIIENTGNSKISPKLVFNPDHLTNDYIIEDLLPNENREINWNVKNNLTLGEHNATIVLLNNNKLLDDRNVSFTILNLDTLKTKAILREVLHDNFYSSNELINIRTLIENSGQTTIEVFSEHKIFLEDNLIDVIKSNPIIISPGKTEKIDMFMNNTVNGNYTIKTLAHYNKRTTNEIETNLIVRDNNFLTGNFINVAEVKDPSFILFIILVFGILWIFIRKSNILEK